MNLNTSSVDKTRTLILSPRYTSDSIALRGAAIESGWQVERLQSWRAPAHLRDGTVSVYGEPLFAAVVADELRLALLEPPFGWMSELPYEIRKRDVHFSTLNEARAHTDRAFIKPADDKCFPAKVYESGAELPTNEVLPYSTPVLIAEPVEWDAEFRCFVLEGCVVTLSVYARDGNLAQSDDGSWSSSQTEMEEALAFSRELLEDERVSLPPSVVLDVGIISNRGWAVVEANASWASGIYGCDPRGVLEVIERGCLKEENLTQRDRQWVVDRPDEGS